MKGAILLAALASGCASDPAPSMTNLTREGVVVQARSRVSVGAPQEVTIPNNPQNWELHAMSRAPGAPEYRRFYPFPGVPCFINKPQPGPIKTTQSGRLYTQAINGTMVQISGDQVDFARNFMVPIYSKNSNGEYVRIN